MNKTVYLIDTNGNKIGSSTDREIEQSIIVDQYGQTITSDNIVINNTVISRNHNVGGFYRLNDLHTAMRNTWIAPTDLAKAGWVL